jgi:hypothetical protein
LHPLTAILVCLLLLRNFDGNKFARTAVMLELNRTVLQTITVLLGDVSF